MIHAEFKAHKSLLRAKMSGHANYSSYNKDIVCAGVSALYNALLIGLKEFSDSEVKVENKTITIYDPDDVAEALFTTYIMSLQDIAQSYPNNLTVRERP